MTTNLLLVALCTMALTGCAQFEDCPGVHRGQPLVPNLSVQEPLIIQILRTGGHHRREMRIGDLMDRKVMGHAGVTMYTNRALDNDSEWRVGKGSEYQRHGMASGDRRLFDRELTPRRQQIQ
jgi:hypothetical protein